MNMFTLAMPLPARSSRIVAMVAELSAGISAVTGQWRLVSSSVVAAQTLLAYGLIFYCRRPWPARCGARNLADLELPIAADTALAAASWGEFWG